MLERMYRTQVLLEPGQHRALAEVARHEGRSISDVVREMVRSGLEERDRGRISKRRLEGLERVRRRREESMRRRADEAPGMDPVEVIHRMREERDEHNLAGSS